MILPENPYKILGVSRDAQTSEIKSAYRKLVLRCHPDKFQDEVLKAQKQDEFQRLQQAYELLTDEHERQKYDNQPQLRDLQEKLAKAKAPSSVPRTPARPFVFEGHTEPRPTPFKSSAPPQQPYPSPKNIYSQTPPSHSWDGIKMKTNIIYSEPRRSTSYEKEKPSRKDEERRRRKEEEDRDFERERRERERELREREREREQREKERERREQERREREREQERLERLERLEKEKERERREKEKEKERRKAEKKRLDKDRREDRRSRKEPYVDSEEEEAVPYAKHPREKSSSGSRKHDDRKHDDRHERPVLRERSSGSATKLAGIKSTKDKVEISKLLAKEYIENSRSKLEPPLPVRAHTFSYERGSSPPPQAPAPPKEPFTMDDDVARRSSAKPRRMSGDSYRERPKEKSHKKSPSKEGREGYVVRDVSPGRRPSLRAYASTPPKLPESPPRHPPSRSYTHGDGRVPVTMGHPPSVLRSATFSGPTETERGRNRSRHSTPQVVSEDEESEAERHLREAKKKSRHQRQAATSYQIRGGRTVRVDFPESSPRGSADYGDIDGVHVEEYSRSSGSGGHRTTTYSGSGGASRKVRVAKPISDEDIRRAQWVDPSLAYRPAYPSSPLAA